MILPLTLVVALVCATPTNTQGEDVEELQEKLSEISERLDVTIDMLGNLARQTMMQQFAGEEKARSDGDSGIKIVRGGSKGPQNYYSPNHVSGGSFASIHDHSNYDRTIGMGEVTVVLNGVEFRTRHNDYKLVMPSTTSNDYHANEPVPFPDVPPEVEDLDDFGEQLEEMRAWFKAFKDQNDTVRDYRKYFKPVMCYLEGTWTLDKELEEPFESDRHSLDASTWFELQQNVRYTSYTGTKNRLENFAYLPTSIMSVNETTGLPNYAQWNYRIVCSPVEKDIPTGYLKQMEDLSHRYPKKKSFDDIAFSRGARFKLYEFDKPIPLKPLHHAKVSHNGEAKYTLIDEIFAKIPGKDNTPDELREDSFGETMFQFDDIDKELNVGYYHRWFKFSKPGAMGLTTVPRGFNDDNLFVAMTTQKRVAPMYLEVCKKKDKCQYFNHRFSFAIPLEIIYLTPLLSWNPLGIEIHDTLKVATANGRNGNENKPLDGVDRENYYITPAALFSGDTDMSDPADTVKNSLYVENMNGDKVVTVASGTRIMLQEMPGVGQVRLRYPIAPVHGEGSSVWKELNALRDYVFEFQSSGGGGAPGNTGGGGNGGGGDDDEDSLPKIIEFETSPAKKPTEHFHTFTLSRKDYLDTMKPGGLQLRVTTSEAAGHTHDLTIRYHYKRGLEYILCDKEKVCWDKHHRKIYMVRDA